ncbi:MAG: thioredoxin domain-containing protein [Gemmatimonadetes bacterium]|nr:thioredoxin domain-containing protein [Gemmatimonadota bacterium]
MPNRLADAASPYLLQHAENPVDWWPWGPEALEEARRLDRPILLSIGYAACHWCHVMAHESFESAETAAVMNAHFVNIKVDREERPDIDGIYMQAVQAMTGHGGWPMTMFLAPDGAPFFGGTYFPPQDRHGMPSFRRVLESVAAAWTSRRDEVIASAASVREMYAQEARLAPGGSVSAGDLHDAFRGIVRMREPQFEGLGRAPKFPHCMALDFCLRHWARSHEPLALEIAHRTFLAMIRGGIYDQVGGGLHRYSTDAQWLVPHFEKMLYDNALLVRLGAHLWQATGDAEVRRATERTIGWVMREMTAPDGGWYSSLDADSEREEGKFYVWTRDEFRRIVGVDADVCERAWGVTTGGNCEGNNILHVADPAFAAGQGPTLERAARALYDTRAKRVWPARDEKVVASWNGLMLRALAESARVFRAPEYFTDVEQAGVFLWNSLVRDGRVLRSWMRGRATIAGFLEDYAALGLGYIGLYQATFDRPWLDRARALSDAMVRWFWDEDAGVFYDTPTDGEALITRPRDIADNATPAGSSLAAELQMFMAEYFGDTAARGRAERVLAAASPAIARMPVMLGHLLGAADMSVHGAVQVAITGSGTDALERVTHAQYLPSLVIAGGNGREVSDLPLYAGRLGDEATAYVCRGYACELPARSAEALASQLRGVARLRE